MRRFIRQICVVAALACLVLSTSAARADWHGHDGGWRGDRGWHGRDGGWQRNWHGGGNWGWRNGVFIGVPSPVYVSPPVYYPPPAVLYAPPPAYYAPYGYQRGY